MSDPYRILGVARDDTDETIRQAYLQGIRRYPPERDQTHFEAIRDAFEALKSKRQRLHHELFDLSVPDADDILAIAFPERAPTELPTELLIGLLADSLTSFQPPMPTTTPGDSRNND